MLFNFNTLAKHQSLSVNTEVQMLLSLDTKIGQIDRRQDIWAAGRMDKKRDGRYRWMDR
jgi:hypothetical protein